MVTVKSILHEPQEWLDKQVSLSGWVRTSRDVKACAFIELNDGSTVRNLQVVVPSDSAFYQLAGSLNVGTAVTARGRVTASPNAQQAVELTADEVVVEGECPSDYPLQKKRHTLEYLRTIQHLRPRTNTFNAVFRVRSEAAFAIHSFFNQRGFVYAHTPIITSSDAEGAGAMFRATTIELDNVPKTEDGKVDWSKDFFGTSTNLTVSGQLEAEVFALAFGKTYTFGPTFRAERSNTTRHAAEFWMIEPEVAFNDLEANAQLAEDMTKYVIRHVLDTCKDEMEFLNKFVDKGLIERLTKIANEESFGRIDYTDAITLLEKNKDNFEFPVFWGCDIQTEHERYLSEVIFNKPVFVFNYPKEIKAYYMRLNDDGKTVAAMDMLVPGIGELIGGSQREERLDVLAQRMKECGLKEEDYYWYMELRKYGGVVHSGYGIGFERLIMYLTGITNIRDVLPFPRTVGNISI
ncbi:MAG: asparagine--tRNA ligase [Ruminococcaceae bacterium]|jgi:asparaginyl-tRNA synthetase|nr:asparagine--tRNA ligase [Oscillospiraceae bacterium]